MVKEIIPIDEPFLSTEELSNLTEAIRTGWIGYQGPYVGRFEKAFAKYHGVKYAQSCFSGTSALIIAMKTLKIGKGDEVMVPTLTFSADAFAVSLADAKVVFVDCSPNRFTMSPDDVKKKITKKTKTIIPTHLYGRPAEVDELKEICEDNNICLIEDCAQAQGAIYKNKKLGSIGDFNIHSFHNKLIATGEGGMITTDNKEFAERFKLLIHPAPMNKTDFNEISINQRISNLHAAIGLAQLGRLEETIKKKLRMAKLYDEHLKDLDGITIIPTDPWTRTVYWRYTILLSQKISRDKVIEESKKGGFITRETYKPLHKHPYYSDYKNQSLPHAEHIGKHGLDIPSSVKLTDEQIVFVANELRKIIKKLRK